MKDINKWVLYAQKVIDIEIEALSCVRDQINSGFVKALEMLALCTGRVIVTGIGKSGLIGKKIVATLSSTGTPSYFLHPVEGAHGDLGSISKDDIILAISNSGETAELNTILPALKTLSAGIVGITKNEFSSLGKFCDAVILAKIEREACPLDLAPTASTTATLALGDALAVCLIKWKSFNRDDFKKNHPGGSLGQHLSQNISTLMQTNNLPTVYNIETLGNSLKIMTSCNFGCLIIIDKTNKLVGILTDGDIRRLVCETEIDKSKPISDFMHKSPRFTYLNSKPAAILNLMEIHQITIMPVVDDTNTLRGLIHLHDLLGKGHILFS